MAAPSNAEPSPERSVPLKAPKTELPSPDSDELSDQFHFDSSTPSRFSSLNVAISALTARGGPASASNNSGGGVGGFTVCRGMSWTPSETNALIAVWGNERLAEARIQQLEVAGTVFSGKAPGPAMYERVSRALAELGYERTPSQCRERMKTLRRCYSRVKEHGIGKRKSSYSIEQLEKVFGQGGWDSQSCQPVLINSSGLYQEMESDGSTMEDYPSEDWCSQELSVAFQEGEIEAEEVQTSKSRVQHLKPEESEHVQRQEAMQSVMRILESVDVKWEHFQTWTDFSRLHLSNKLAIFGVGYNTRWREEIRYHYAEISSQVPLGKRLREYFNPEKAEGRIIMTKVQKMNWKNVYYKFLDITISEARCLELHMEVDWIPIAQTKSSGCSSSQYLIPGGIPKTFGLYAIGYVEETGTPSSENSGSPARVSEKDLHGSELKRKRTSDKITYCYLGIAEERTLQQSLFQHFQVSQKPGTEVSAINKFLQENSSGGGNSSPDFPICIKFIEVELDFLSAGSLVECLETAIGYSLKFNKTDTLN